MLENETTHPIVETLEMQLYFDGVGNWMMVNEWTNVINLIWITDHTHSIYVCTSWLPISHNFISPHIMKKENNVNLLASKSDFIAHASTTLLQLFGLNESM
jgi:hypothetical protein